MSTQVQYLPGKYIKTLMNKAVSDTKIEREMETDRQADTERTPMPRHGEAFYKININYQ